MHLFTSRSFLRREVCWLLAFLSEGQSVGVPRQQSQESSAWFCTELPTCFRSAGGGTDGGVDGDSLFGEGDEGVTEERWQPPPPASGEPNALASPEAAAGASGVTGRDTRDFPGALGSAAAEAAEAAEAGPAGMNRRTTASTAGRAGHQHQNLRPYSPLLVKRDAALGAVARPETAGKTAAVAVPSSLGRSNSSRVLAGAGGCRTGSLNRLKTKAGGTGMRVLLPGQGARDYASLLKGSGTLRGRELEARVATAEAEVGTESVCGRWEVRLGGSVVAYIFWWYSLSTPPFSSARRDSSSPRKCHNISWERAMLVRRGRKKSKESLLYLLLPLHR